MGKIEKIKQIYEKLDIIVREEDIDKIIKDESKVKGLMRIYKNEKIESMNYIFGKEFCEWWRIADVRSGKFKKNAGTDEGAACGWGKERADSAKRIWKSAAVAHLASAGRDDIGMDWKR